MTLVAFKTSKGSPQPFGAQASVAGVNFSIVSVHAQSMTLCLFSPENNRLPVSEYHLDPLLNKTGNVWHIFIHDLPLDFLYLYRVNGRSDSLLDPYAREVITTHTWGANNAAYSPLCGITIENTFDWQSDLLPGISAKDLVIYEMHVRGFTQDASSGVKNPGTYLGVIEKIPHLLDLGVNAVELMPIHEFNECEVKRINPLTKQRLYNYWGYSTVNFFSPMQRYASNNNRGAAINEFQTMVRELHRNGIEVILDVVYNHTSESIKGLDNHLYYIMDDQGRYLDYSGCGNTFNCNHPVARELILDSLRYWVSEMHVDGFRFDLASILTRGTKGHPLLFSPLIERISYDPILANVKLIAEPWDVAGLYQVGSFFSQGGGRWSEWNARYRDVVRNFIKGTGHKGAFGTNISGSQDLYHSDSPTCSINFVVAHDGFTLMDLVSYLRKHNLGNGEDNRDGLNNNDSWNCGVEGQTSNHAINAIRQRQMRNFHLALMISQGTPMIFMGDEYAHTKLGNNNPWCQDNTLNWFLWDNLAQHKDFYRFYRGLIHFRKDHAILKEDRFLTPQDIEWHGLELGHPTWNVQDHFVAFTLKDRYKGEDLYVAFNAGKEPVQVELPTLRNLPIGMQWRWVVNTGAEPPNDFFETAEGHTVEETQFEMLPYSALMLKLERFQSS